MWGGNTTAMAISVTSFPIGQQMDVTYPLFTASLTLLSATQLMFDITDGPFARCETVEIEVVPLGNSRFIVSWRESDGATVVNVQDFDRGLVHSVVTPPSGELVRMTGMIVITWPAEQLSDDRPERNKRLVMDAMTSLFQRHDAAAVDRLYAPDYIQHNPEIPQGRDALRAIVAGLPENVHYEPGMIVAEGDLVAIHGRIHGWSDAPQVVVDLFRVERGKLAEHWDVLQNEVLLEVTTGGVAMFEPQEANQRLDRHQHFGAA